MSITPKVARCAQSRILDAKYLPFISKSALTSKHVLHFIPSVLHSAWTLAASQRECAPAVMMASVCGLLRQPVNGEIAALAPCILGLGVGGGLAGALLCGFSGL